MQYFSLSQSDQIRQLIVGCGQQANRLSTKEFQVFEKGADDYVTTVDRALDLELTHGFATLFPEDGIISEENPQSRQIFHAEHANVWVIDPIDGTEDFIQREPYYAVMVGLLHRYTPLAGWIYAPALEMLYCGGQDWGVFQASAQQSLQAIPLREPQLSQTEPIPFILSHKDQRRFGAAITQYMPNAQFYALGSFGLKVMEVVLGRAGLYLYLNRRVKLWDTAGPLAIAQAAGLICCDLEGNPIGFDPGFLDQETLTHHQMILVGWPSWVQQFRPLLKRAVAEVLSNPGLNDE